MCIERDQGPKVEDRRLYSGAGKLCCGIHAQSNRARKTDEGDVCATAQDRSGPEGHDVLVVRHLTLYRIEGLVLEDEDGII